MLAQSSPPPAQGPVYVTSSIVNAANYKANSLAPNTLATLYGTNLAYVTRALSSDDIAGGILPTALAGTGVKLLVAKVPVPLLYVSPNQVNFLVPSGFPVGPVEVQLGLDSRFGPPVTVRIAEVSPALFMLDPEFVVGTRADGSLLTRDAPAKAGEVVVLYATGLGATEPRVPMGHAASEPAGIVKIATFRVTLGGIELPPENVLYAGVTPGFAGLYQVNVKLPDLLGRNPEVLIGFGEVKSPAGTLLYAQ